MTTAERKELVREHEEGDIMIGHSLPTEKLELMAEIMFPTGTLPEDSDPPKFTARELEIMRNLLWKTKKMNDRVSRAHLRRSMVDLSARGRRLDRRHAARTPRHGQKDRHEQAVVQYRAQENARAEKRQREIEEKVLAWEVREEQESDGSLVPLTEARVNARVAEW